MWQPALQFVAMLLLADVTCFMTVLIKKVRRSSWKWNFYGLVRCVCVAEKIRSIKLIQS